MKKKNGRQSKPPRPKKKHPAASAPRLVSVDDAAAMLSVSRGKVNEMRADGTFTTVPITKKRVALIAAEIVAYVEARIAQALAAPKVVQPRKDRRRKALATPVEMHAQARKPSRRETASAASAEMHAPEPTASSVEAHQE